jgi:hypothetical protein
VEDKIRGFPITARDVGTYDLPKIHMVHKDLAGWQVSFGTDVGYIEKFDTRRIAFQRVTVLCQCRSSCKRGHQDQ